MKITGKATLVLLLALATPALAQDDAVDRESAAARRSRCERLLTSGDSPSLSALKKCGVGTGGGAAKGDFNADGFADLAIGVPYEGTSDNGAVEVLYGSANGLTSIGDLGLSGPSAGHFGWALASGDFNGDGFSDLAAGAPDYDIIGDGTSRRRGIVRVYYGSATGLGSTSHEINPPGYGLDLVVGIRFGASLVWADFNADGYADLAVGAPASDVTIDVACAPSHLFDTTAAGAVSVYFGGPNGLPSSDDDHPTPATFHLMQGDCAGREDQVGDTRDTSDNFGTTLAAIPRAAGDRLVVGVPYENSVNGDVNSGMVHIVTFGGTTSTSFTVLSQDTAGVSGGAESYDHFGWALAAGDFAGDGTADLAVGVPDEDLDNSAGVSQSAAGAVQIFPNGGVTGNRFISQTDIGDLAESGDQFGFALTAGDFDGDGRKDLAIGTPGENYFGLADVGVVNVMYGSATGLSTSRTQAWHQDSIGIADSAEAGDRFGFSLSSWNFGRSSQADLAIGVPYEDVVSATTGTSMVDAGAVHVLYGSSTGLTATGSQFWHQDVSGVQGAVEPGDMFGMSLY